MKKLISSILALIIALSCCVIGASADNKEIALSDSEKQDIFSHALEMMYNDYPVYVFTGLLTYDQFCDKYRAELDFDKTEFHCFYKSDGVIITEMKLNVILRDVKFNTQIGDYEFDFPGVGDCLYVYKDNELKNIRSGYMDGTVTDNMLDSVFAAGYEFMTQNPLIDLSSSEKQAMFDAAPDMFYNDFVWDYSSNQTFDEFTAYFNEHCFINKSMFLCYYNKDGVIIASIDNDFSAIDGTWYPVVDDYVFNFSGYTQALYVYKDGVLRNLTTAYKAGDVTDAMVDEVYANGYKFMTKIGDGDGDGQITVSDIIELRSAIMKYDDSNLDLTTSPVIDYKGGSRFSVYDVNGDEKITVSDVIDLRKIIMK